MYTVYVQERKIAIEKSKETLNKLVGESENCIAKDEGSRSFSHAIPSKRSESYNKSFTVPLGSFEASVMKLFAAACNLISYTVSENKEREE